MITLLLYCEAVEEHPRLCEENVAIEGLDDVLSLEVTLGATELSLDGALTLPEGWTVVEERGGNRLRCPKHSGS